MTIKALYPNVRPSLDLNFARTRALDPRITYTRDSTGTFVGSDGLIKTAASGVARFDHNPATGESLGLLVEEGRTNLIRQSIVRPDLPNDTYSFWTPVADTVITANAATAPDGTLTAALVENNTTATGDMLRRYEQSLANVSGLVDSIWLKSTGGTVTVAMYGSPTAQDAITNVTFGSTWTRLSMRRPASGNYFLKLIKLSTASVSFYAWGGQTEIGTFSTSYIPTSGATVTRSADVVSMTGTNFSSWYNNTEGTFVTDAILAFTQNAGNPFTFGGVFYTIVNNAFGAVRTLGNGEVMNGGLSNSLTSFSKAAVALKSGNFAIGLNGSISNTSSIVYTPNGSQWAINSSLGSLARIKRLTYYPVRLPDAQLQALTQ